MVQSLASLKAYLVVVRKGSFLSSLVVALDGVTLRGTFLSTVAEGTLEGEDKTKEVWRDDRTFVV